MKVNTHTSDVTIDRIPNAGEVFRLFVNRVDWKSSELIIKVTGDGVDIFYVDPDIPITLYDRRGKKRKLSYPWKREEKKVD